MKNRALICILALLEICCLLCGCAKADPFAYRSTPFSAVLSGEIDGLTLQARIYCDPTDHNTKEIYTLMTVSYTAPESLKGITVTLTSDGKSYARLNDMEMGEQSVAGMAELFHLLCPSDPPTSLKQDGERLEVVFSSDSGSYTVYFDKIGEFPSKIKGNLGERDFDIGLLEYTTEERQD